MKEGTSLQIPWTFTERIIKKYKEQLYVQKVDNLNEMNQFLEKTKSANTQTNRNRKSD